MNDKYSIIYMNFLQNTIIFFGGILIYLHIYIHFKISKFNDFSQIQDVSKEKIMSTIYYKLPFVFDGTSILKQIDLKTLKDEKKNIKDVTHIKDVKCKKDKRIYKKTYQNYPLLEPSVRFFTNDTVYELKKNKKIDLHRNLECRNFYMVHSGKIDAYCIHPKYKNIDDIDKFIENNEILHVELYPNSILFVPNYWYVYIKSSEKSIIEKVQYKTILNEVIFLYETYKI